MRNVTSKRLRKYAKAAKLDYRTVKREWNQIPRCKRGQVAKLLELHAGGVK